MQFPVQSDFKVQSGSLLPCHLRPRRSLGVKGDADILAVFVRRKCILVNEPVFFHQGGIIHRTAGEIQGLVVDAEHLRIIPAVRRPHRA